MLEYMTAAEERRMKAREGAAEHKKEAKELFNEAAKENQEVWNTKPLEEWLEQYDFYSIDTIEVQAGGHKVVINLLIPGGQQLLEIFKKQPMHDANVYQGFIKLKM